MPLPEQFTLAVQRHLAHAEEQFAARARPPPPPPKPLLDRQTLARVSPQPDRRVAVKAARVPLIEAARPLLKAMATMPAALDAQQIDAFHSALVTEVTLFQSVCWEAGIWNDEIIMASYMLCAALDDLACHTPWGQRAELPAATWDGRLLSVQFHGDNQGGAKVFVMMGFLLNNQPQHIDLMELLVLIVALGFEGGYRRSEKSRLTLYDIQRQLCNRMRGSRVGSEPSARWDAIERLIKGDVAIADLLADPAMDLFS